MLEGRSSAPLLWVAWVAPALAFVLLGARGPLADVTWHSPLMLFWLVVVAASLCVVVALAVITIGWIRRLAEVAILGAAVLAVSLLPLVHGLTTPGILYADNSATLVSAFLAVPLAIMIAAPVILPGLPSMRQLALRWRSATVTAILATLALAALLLARPNVLPSPQLGQSLTYAAVAISLAGALTLSLRHLRLHRIGGRRASFVASVGLSTSASRRWCGSSRSRSRSPGGAHTSSTSRASSPRSSGSASPTSATGRSRRSSRRWSTAIRWSRSSSA